MLTIDTMALAGAAVVFVLAFVAATIFRVSPLDRRWVNIIAVVWILTVTAQYWVLGSSSYTYGGDDGAQPIANFLHWNRTFTGGPFLHGPMGGVDARAMIAGSGSLISLERSLLAILPLWLAIFLQKALVALAALSGTYLLTRRCGGASRGVALALGCVYSVAHHFMTIATFHPGLGYALIPWFIYLIVGRADDRPLRYYGRIAVLSCLHATTTIPTHNLMGTVPALFFAAMALNIWRPKRFALAFVLMMAPILANWHEGLLALLKFAPYSGRVQFYSAEYDLRSALDLAIPGQGYGETSAALLAAAVLVLVQLRAPGRIHAAAAALGAFALGPLLLIVPWKALGLASLAAINFSYTSFAIHPLAVLLGARALMCLRHGAAGTPRTGTVALAAVIALAMSLMAWQKILDVCYWLGDGSQKNLTSIPNLVDRPWAPDTDFRVVSIPFQIRPNYMLAYGLDTLDGYINAANAASYRYWNSLVTGGSISQSGRAQITPHGFDPLCCEVQDFDALADVALLRQANVEFVISVLPLKGRSLRQVSGPTEQHNPFLRSLPFRQKLTAYMARIIDPGPVFVYSIGTPTPRVFGASGLEVVPDSMSDTDFHHRIAAHVDDRKAVIRQGQTPPELPSGQVEVLGYRKLGTGFQVSVSAPQGGVLVLNTPYIPFWTATTGGKALTVFPVNEVHTGIVLPSGAEDVEVRYDRGAPHPGAGAANQ